MNDAKEPFKYIPSKTFSGSKNEISKVSPQSVINSVCRTRLFTRAGPDKESQTGSSGAMEGPEPRREKSCSFSQTPCRKKKKNPDHKRGSVLEAISEKSSSQDRSTESTSEMEREREKGALFG